MLLAKRPIVTVSARLTVDFIMLPSHADFQADKSAEALLHEVYVRFEALVSEV